MEILDIKVKVRKVRAEDSSGFGIGSILEGVILKDVVKSVNTALVAKGSKSRVQVVEK